MSKRRTILLTTLAALLALMVSACSGADDSATMDTITDANLFSGEQSGDTGGAVDASATEPETMSEGDTGSEPAGREGEQAEQSDGDSTAGNGAVQPVSGPVDLGRDIIFTAELTVAVRDVAVAGAEAGRVIERHGGFLFGQQTTGGNRPSTILTFKVFPEDFQATLADLGSIGEIRNQTVSADDVTERVVDLQSRINTAQASVERLRGFLENADDLETIASLENQLLQRETDLEQLRGQLRTLENQVALATIVVTLTEARIEPGILLQTSFYPGHEDGGFACPGSNGLTVEVDEPVTACFFISNTGDTPLTDLSLVDSVLDVRIDDLTPVIGDPAELLLPGESIMLSHEFVADANLRTRTTVAAQPADPEGTVLDERAVASTTSITLEVTDPYGITSFSDGLAESWDLLVSMARVGLLVLAWLIPFAWVPLLIWGLVRLATRRTLVTAQPPPPAEHPDAEKEPASV